MKSKPVVWLSAVCACLLALGNHHFLGIETLKTPRGNIRVPHVAAETYHRLVARLDELDPTHQQGVLPLRFQSLSLFLDRPNPTRMTQGFVLTDESTPDILKHIFETKPIILFSAGQEDVLPDHYTRPEKIDDLDTLLPAYEAIFEHYRRADGEYRIGPWDIFIPRESGNAVATLGS